VFGLAGGLLILASLILASQTFLIPHNVYQFAEMQHTLWTLVFAVVGVVVTAMVLRRWIPRAPIVSEILLEPPSRDEARSLSFREFMVDRQEMVGRCGTAATPLVPGGKARIGNELLDVTADGEVVARGTEIVVTEVRGSRILVKAAPGRGGV
jgi:membrane-bound serine protease (ClpP class)